MPNNLTDDPTQFPGPVQVPSSTDPMSDTSVATPFQQVANRTANNKARIDAIAPSSAPGYSPVLPPGVSSGISQLITATTLAALTSIPIANRVDGMVCYVYGDALYQYSVTATDTVSSPQVIATVDGTGRWLRDGYRGLNIANGVPQLDGDARLAAAVPRNGTVYDEFLQFTDSTSHAAGALSPISGSVFSPLDCLAGDVVHVDLTLTTLLPATVGCDFYANVDGLFSSTGVTVAASGSPQPTAVTTFCSFTLGADGSYTVQGEVFPSSSGGNLGISKGEIRVRVVRP